MKLNTESLKGVNGGQQTGPVVSVKSQHTVRLSATPCKNSRRANVRRRVTWLTALGMIISHLQNGLAHSCVKQSGCVLPNAPPPPATLSWPGNSLTYVDLATCLNHCDSLGPTACPSVMFYDVNGVTCYVFTASVTSDRACSDGSLSSAESPPSLWYCSGSVDECSTGSDNCDANAVCTDTAGSFTCSCNPGWQTSDNGVTCTDVVECGVSDNCDANAACADGSGSFQCTCSVGFESSDDGVTCDACQAGEYQDVAGSTFCAQCPANTISAVGSDALQDCVCAIGFAGSDGQACDACQVGKYKGTLGSGTCSDCRAGSFLNSTGGSACISCPSNAHSLAASADIAACVCNIGYEGADGTPCTACALGNYKSVNGSTPCAECAAGAYLNVTGGSLCLGCPANTDSEPGSDDVHDCICNIGHAGLDGAACSACPVGSYKPVNGSGSCEQCEAGKYVNHTGASTCSWCVANTHSLQGSDDVTDCICNIGYEGSDGVACSACGVGLYKAVNGSGKCTECEAGTYLNETGGSVCKVCPTNTHSPAGSSDITDCICNIGFAGTGALAVTQPGVACYPVFNTSQCFEQNISLSRSCSAEAIRVRGCALSHVDFETSVLQTAEGGSIPDVLSSCGGFYDWICRALGARPSTAFECGFYCDFLSTGLRSRLESECRTHDECSVDALAGETSLRLSPEPGSLCADTAKYALFTSCLVTEDEAEGFAEAVEGLLKDANESCGTHSQTVDESLLVTSPIPAPWWLGEGCEETQDCSEACFLRDFEVKRQGSTASIAAVSAADECNCSTRAVFSGTWEYAQGIYLQASNAEGAVLSARPLPAVNQIIVDFSVEKGKSCTVMWRVSNVGSGSLLGLPVATALEDTLDASLLFVGRYQEGADVLLSVRATSPSAVQQAYTSAAQRRLQAVLPTDAECPTEETDCRYACLSDGFSANAFGAMLSLTPRYDRADCNCSSVFLGGQMLGTLVDQGTFSFLFSGAFDLAETGGSVLDAVVDVSLRPWQEGTLRLDFMPTNASADPCSYIVAMERGVLMGVAAAVQSTGAPSQATADAQESNESASQQNDANATLGEQGLEISVEDAEAAAAVVSAAVGATTAAVVASSVASAVAGAVASATGGAVGGGVGGSAASSGQSASQAAVQLVLQCGNIAAMSRVGDSTLPESAAAFGASLAWANAHPPVNAWALFREGDASLTYLGGTAASSGNESGRRAAKGSSGADSGGDLTAAPSAVRGCEAAQRSQRDLFGTLLLVLAVMCVAFLLREAINSVVRGLQRRHGKEPGDPALPFPMWELQIVIIFFLGLAESAGEAVATGCIYYEVVGAVVLLLLMTFGTLLLFVVFVALHHSVVVWTQVSFREGCAQAKHEWALGKNKSAATKAKHGYAAWVIVKQRGQWEVQEKAENPTVQRLFGERFSDRMGCLFDSYQQDAWWFGFWTICKAFAVALVLTNVLVPTVNAALLVGINAIETILMLVLQPDADWSLYFVNTWKAWSNLGSLVAALAFIEGLVPDVSFTAAFVFLQGLSLVPCMIAAALQPLASVLRGVYDVFFYCYYALTPESLFTAGAAAGGVAAVKAVGLVAANDNTMQQVVLDAIADDSDSDKDGDQVQSKQSSKLGDGDRPGSTVGHGAENEEHAGKATGGRRRREAWGQDSEEASSVSVDKRGGGGGKGGRERGGGGRGPGEEGGEGGDCVAAASSPSAEDSSSGEGCARRSESSATAVQGASKLKSELRPSKSNLRAPPAPRKGGRAPSSRLTRRRRSTLAGRESLIPRVGFD